MTSRPDDQEDPFGRHALTTPTRGTNRIAMQDSVFLSARLPPAAERGTSGQNTLTGQGRLSPMKRALSPDNHSQRYHHREQRPTSRQELSLKSPGEYQNSTRADYWEDPARSYAYTTPTKSSFDTDGPRLHDLASPDGVPYIPRDEVDVGSSRRSTLEGEGATGWPSPPRESASTDRLVTRNGAQGIPVSLVQALGFGSTGDDLPSQSMARPRGTRDDRGSPFHPRPLSSDSTYRTHQYPPDRHEDLVPPAAPRLYDLNRMSVHSRPFNNFDPEQRHSRTDFVAGPAYKSNAEPYRRKTSDRKYKRLESQPLQSNSYFCRGRLVTGGDSILPLICSFVIVFGLGGLWLGTTGVWMWRDGLGGGGAGAGGKAAVIIFGYLLGTCIGAMIATAFRDPGRCHPFLLG